MKYANITNNMYVNKYDGESRITCICMNKNSKIELFSVPISTPSGAVSMSKDPILGKTRTINDIFQKQGNLGGSTTGTVQLATKTTNMTLKNDFAYLAPTGQGIEMSRNTLEGILNGQGFMDTLTSTYWKVVGTNGAIKKSTTTDQNYLFKKLFEIDGRLVIGDAGTEAGHAITVKNVRSSVYDKTCVYMVFENISKFDDDNIEGVRCVYVMHSEVSVSDADDANEISFTQTQLCDIRNIKTFLINGFGDDEIGATIPARPGMISKTGITMFKASIEATDISVDSATSKIEVDLTGKIPTNVVKLNSTTQEYETTAYTPVAKDIAVLYIPKTELQLFVDNTDVVTVDSSGFALAVYNGTVWELADAGKIKESTVLTGTAVTAGTFAAPATPTATEKKTEIVKRIYATNTWNFETSAFEAI